MKQKRVMEIVEGNKTATTGELIVAIAFTTAMLALMLGFAACAAIGFLRFIGA
mgnify:CR=1 FL=1